MTRTVVLINETIIPTSLRISSDISFVPFALFSIMYHLLRYRKFSKCNHFGKRRTAYRIVVVPSDINLTEKCRICKRKAGKIKFILYKFYIFCRYFTYKTHISPTVQTLLLPSQTAVPHSYGYGMDHGKLYRHSMQHRHPNRLLLVRPS